jgi:predicted phage-related endonuclease
MEPQGSEQWFLDRAGSATGSRFKDYMPNDAGKYLKAREDYIADCVTERITGKPIRTSHGKAGDWGTKMEPFARLAYEQKTGLIVQEAGFIRHPDIDHCGVSPDGLINEDGGSEIKCPINASIHLSTLMNNEMPEEHIPQVQGSMMVTGRDWWDFVSYNPSFPEPMKLYIKRIRRNDMYIRLLEEETMLFLSDVESIVNRLTKEYAL